MVPLKNLHSLGAGAILILMSSSFLYLSIPGKLKIPDGNCWKGGNTTALSRVNDLKTHYDLQEMLEGPGLSDKDDSRAACKFVTDDHTPHFPHAMQQLYRCFSWWMANPRKDPYLILPKNAPITTNFLKGMIESLRVDFGVRVVHFRSNLKVVRPTGYKYAFDEKHAFAMASPQDARTLRSDILQSKDINHMSCPSKPRIGILNRRNNRSILNIRQVGQAVVDSLQERIEDSIRVATFDEESFEGQLEFLANVDILISPHGAQLTGIPFLPQCAHVLELFPGGYHVPEFYASLAAVSNVQHAYLYLGNNIKRESKVAMKSLESREAARSVNVCPNVPLVIRAVNELLESWEACCKERHGA